MIKEIIMSRLDENKTLLHIETQYEIRKMLELNYETEEEHNLTSTKRKILTRNRIPGGLTQ